MSLNVRQKQREVLLRILNLNAPASSISRDPGELYKVLVLDKFSKDIIAPLLRLNELRRHGVTLHLTLESDRMPIADVPAVYIVRPTPANVERLIQDASSNLYESMHLNFTASLPSRLLEQLAAGVVKAGALGRVGKLFDQYVSFIALEPSLFSLGLPSAYVDLNDPSARDTEIEASVSAIVDGLFSVCVTLGVAPIIRCPRGGASEHVAMLLDQRLRDALKLRNNLFSEGVLGLSTALSRPLLCLFDRNFDLSAAVQHGWTYKPLVHDVLDMRLNRVTIAPDAGPGPSSAAAAAFGPKKAYDVDDKDFFWEACGAHAFPKVAEEVQTQLQRYSAAVEEINRRTNAGAAEGPYDPDELLKKNTHNLMQAVSSLPELQEQKKTLDKHTNLATALLRVIKERGLDQYHSLGEELLLGKADLQAVVKAVQGARGTPADKLRVALIYLLAHDGLPSDSELSDLDHALKSVGADTAALAYVRTLKRNNLTGSGGKGTDGGTALASQGNLLDWADKAFGQGISQVTKVAKNLLSGARQAPLTVALENLMEGRAGTPEFDTYHVMDAKSPAGRVGLERAKGPFREAIVFVIGGGNYLERETLLTWAQRQVPPKAVTYGCTEVLTGDEFVAQLAELGRRSGAAH